MNVAGRADAATRGALLGLMGLLTWLTWQGWGTLLVDSGREMYIPAAIAQGKRLYFDLWYPYGPLIPYWHALLFRVFGVHLGVLYAAGLTITAVFLMLVYSLARRFLPVSLSFAAAFLYLCVALQMNSFNFVLPYSYPAAYGALMVVTLVWLLVRDPFSNDPWRVGLGGLLAGATLATKVEMGVAACGILVCAIALRATAAKSLAAAGRDAGFSLPGIVAAVLTYAGLVQRSSLDFLFGENIPLLPSSYFVMQFGRYWSELSGFTTSPAALLRSCLMGLGGAAVVIAGLVLCARSKLARMLCIQVAVGLSVLRIAFTFIVYVAGEPLPGVLGWVSAQFFFLNPGLLWMSFTLLGVSLYRCWRERSLSRERAALLLLAAASVGMGVRVLTKVDLYFYSVYYAVLAYLAWIVAVYVIAQRWRVPAAVWRGLSVALCASVVALIWLEYWTPRRPFLVRTERGSIRTDPFTGATFMKVLGFLEGARTRAEKFAV